MPDLTLDLAVVDTDGFPVIDPDIVLRLARSDGSAAKAYRIALNGQRSSLTLRDAPAGSALILRLTPSRYRDIAAVCRVDGERVRPASDEPLIAPRRPSEWLPVFTRWAALPELFDDLKTALQGSRRFRLGRTSQPGQLIDAAYDGVDPRDESSALAKLSMLNLYSRLASESAPTTGQPWSKRIRELFIATRERIIAQVDESCFATVHQLSQSEPEGYFRSPVGGHVKNLEEIPGVSSVTEPASVKTKEDKANLQFIVARAVVDGQPAFLLDCDIDENGRLLLHTFDLIKHAFSGGTQPIDVHEALRTKFPRVPIGYSLEPKVPVPEVTARIITPAISESAATSVEPQK
jgi:hypothetical protein